MADKNMNAKISVEFEETANRQQLSSGDNLPTLFGKIKKIISDLATSAFSGSYNDLSDKPTSLPANGGNADTVDGFHISTLTNGAIGNYVTTVARINFNTKKIETWDTSSIKVGLADKATNADKVNNHTVNSDVPADAVFTDTTYSTGTDTTSGITKLYTSTGDNTDGAMTQKAITEALSSSGNINPETEIEEIFSGEVKVDSSSTSNTYTYELSKSIYNFDYISTFALGGVRDLFLIIIKHSVRQVLKL